MQKSGTGVNNFVKWKGTFRSDRPKWADRQSGPPSNLVPNIAVGPNRNGPFHLISNQNIRNGRRAFTPTGSLFNFPQEKQTDTHAHTNKRQHQRETKLPTYWNTPFNKICLGMKIGSQFKSVVIIHQARSLYSLIADGKYRATSLGRNTWKKLIGSRASLQPNCNKEGFNVLSSSRHSKARIGIYSNRENDCNSCDSRIGFGTGGYPNDSNTCGNEADKDGTDNGDQSIKAMGYILVQ